MYRCFGHWKSNIIVGSLRGCISPRYVFPDGLVNKSPKVIQIPTSWDLLDCTMVSSIATCKFNAISASDAFKHVPDLFQKGPEPEDEVEGPGAGHMGVSVA